ncbi:Uma2 family endonuclease [Streptomyces griseomycini]|uniref:Uma2 family endonuclease n=1 Tax=Streptomyces griseomycini TaxID=66895 RepID=UPI003F4D97AD
MGGGPRKGGRHGRTAAGADPGRGRRPARPCTAWPPRGDPPGKARCDTPPDGSHQLAPTRLGRAFDRAGIVEAGQEHVRGAGPWLPTSPADFAIPDFSVVDEDFRGAHVTGNHYAPDVFRLVVEITSSNWSDDLGPKAECYAQAGVPACLIVDPKHDEVLLRTEPADGKYPGPRRFERGQDVAVPEPVGVRVELSADTLLDGWNTGAECRTPVRDSPHVRRHRSAHLPGGTRPHRPAPGAQLALRPLRRRPQGRPHRLRRGGRCLHR